MALLSHMSNSQSSNIYRLNSCIRFYWLPKQPRWIVWNETNVQPSKNLIIRLYWKNGARQAWHFVIQFETIIIKAFHYVHKVLWIHISSNKHMEFNNGGISC